MATSCPKFLGISQHFFVNIDTVVHKCLWSCIPWEKNERIKIKRYRRDLLYHCRYSRRKITVPNA